MNSVSLQGPLSHEGNERILRALPAPFMDKYSLIYVSVENPGKFSQDLIDKAAKLFLCSIAEQEMAEKCRRRKQADKAIAWQNLSSSHMKEYEQLCGHPGFVLRLSMMASPDVLREPLAGFFDVLDGALERLQNDSFKNSKEAVNALLDCLNHAYAQKEIEVVRKAFEKADRLFQEQTGSSWLKQMIEEDPYTAERVLKKLKPEIIAGEAVLLVACEKVRGEVNVEIVRELLKFQMDKENALVALMEGAAFESNKWQEAIFALLLEAGADPNINIRGAPLFSYCLEKRLTKCTDKIFDRCDLDKEDTMGRRAIHHAVFQGNFPLVQALIKKKVNLNVFGRENIFSSRSITPCHIAVNVDNSMILELLVRAKANPHLRALNPHYDNPILSEWSKLEPISPFQQAVDRDQKGCIDVILKYAPPQASDLRCHFTREGGLGSIGIEAFRRGYLSLEKRVRGEVLKTQHKLKAPEGISVYTNDTKNLDKIQTFFDTFFIRKEFGICQAIAEPVINAMHKFLMKNPDFVFAFVPLEELGGLGGEFNGDSQKELFVGVDLENPNEMLATLLHECTHVLANAFFPGHHCAPPQSYGFMDIVTRDVEALKASQSPHAPLVLDTLHGTVERNYHFPQARPAEYLARIPHCAILLAFKEKLQPKEFDTAIRDCLTHLHLFWHERFIPLCKSL